MDEKGFSGAVEYAINELADHTANDLVLRMGRAIEEGAVLPPLLQIAFGFEDFHHGHHGRVGDFAVLEQGFINIADGGALTPPNELHDFEFLGRERCMLRSHGCDLYSTN